MTLELIWAAERWVVAGMHPCSAAIRHAINKLKTKDRRVVPILRPDAVAIHHPVKLAPSRVGRTLRYPSPHDS